MVSHFWYFLGIFSLDRVSILCYNGAKKGRKFLRTVRYFLVSFGSPITMLLVRYFLVLFGTFWARLEDRSFDLEAVYPVLDSVGTLRTL